MMLDAFLAMNSLRVALTVDAVSSVSGLLEQLLVKVAPIGELGAVASLRFL